MICGYRQSAAVTGTYASVCAGSCAQDDRAGRDDGALVRDARLDRAVPVVAHRAVEQHPELGPVRRAAGVEERAELQHVGRERRRRGPPARRGGGPSRPSAPRPAGRRRRRRRSARGAPGVRGAPRDCSDEVQLGPAVRQVAPALRPTRTGSRPACPGGSASTSAIVPSGISRRRSSEMVRARLELLRVVVPVPAGRVDPHRLQQPAGVVEPQRLEREPRPARELPDGHLAARHGPRIATGPSAGAEGPVAGEVSAAGADDVDHEDERVATLDAGLRHAAVAVAQVRRDRERARATRPAGRRGPRPSRR